MATAESATLPAHSSGEDFAELEPVDQNNYELGSVLARGGMGQIVYARDRRTGRPVAIKQIADHLLDDMPADQRRALIGRFQREARVTARLQHPSIVSVYEVGSFGGRPFFAMRLVQGEPLDRVIARCDSFEARLALLPRLIAVADALAYAHDQRVIHRDLKPANVIVGSFNDTVVIDWGLAKDLRSDDRADSHPPWRPAAVGDVHTIAGSVFGTPHYMPPEQAAGDVVDERADVYAIGAILYHLLAGVAPYASDDERTRAGGLLDEIRLRPPLSLDQVEATVPADLASIVVKAMQRAPANRYANAAELAADLRQFEAGQLVAVHDYSPVDLARRWMRRNLAAIVVGVSLMMVMVVLGAIGMWGVHDARVRAEAAADRAQDRNDEAALMMERNGRTELLAGRFAMAAKALAKSYELGNRRDSLRMLLDDSIRRVRSTVLESYDEDSMPRVWVSGRGRLAARGAHGGVVKVWDMTDGRVVHELAVGEPISTVAVSADDRVIAAGTDSGRVVLWDARSGVVRIDQVAHRGQVFRVMFDGELAISVGADGWMQLYRDGRALGRFEHTSAAYASSPVHITAGVVGGDGRHHAVMAAWVDGTILHSVSAEGVYLQRDMATGRPVADEFIGPLHNLLVDREHRTLVATAMQILVTFDLGDMSMTQVTLPNAITSLDVSSDKRRAAVGLVNGQVGIVDLAAGEVVRLIDAHPSDVTSASFIRGGDMVVSGGADGLVRVWDVGSGTELTAFGLAEHPIQLCWPNRDGTRIVTASADGLRLWRLDDDMLPLSIDVAGRLWTIKLLDEDRRLLAVHDRGAEIWDLEARRQVSRLDIAKDDKLLVSADGGVILTKGRFHDVERGQEMGALPATYDPVSLAVRSDRERAIVGIGTGGAIIVDPRTGELLGTIRQNRAIVMFAAFLPDDTILALSADGWLSVFSDRGETIARLGEHKGVRFMEVSADGARAATADDRGLRLWDLHRRTLIGGGRGHIRRARFSRDGTRLITAQYDKRAVMWDGVTGERLFTLRGHTARVNEAFLDATGERATTVGTDGHTRVWDARSGALLWQRPSDPAQSIGAMSSRREFVVTAAGTRLYVWPMAKESRNPAEVSAEIANIQLNLGSTE